MYYSRRVDIVGSLDERCHHRIADFREGSPHEGCKDSALEFEFDFQLDTTGLVINRLEFPDSSQLAERAVNVIEMDSEVKSAPMSAEK